MQQDRAPQGRLVYIAVGLFFALLVSLYFFYEIRAVALVFLLTLLFTIIVSGPVDYLAHRGVRRGWGMLLVLGGSAGGLWLAGMALAPTISAQARALGEDLPVLLAEVQGLLNWAQGFLGLELGLDLQRDQAFEAAQDFLSGGAFAAAAAFGVSIASGITFTVVALIATVYLGMNPAPVVNGFVSLFPAGWRERVRSVLTEMYHAVQKWFLGQLASMTIIGVLSAIALSIIGIDFAILIGIFSGLISFVPFVGPVFSVIPPVLLALISNPIAAVWVVLAYIGIQQFESHVIQPVVMSRAVSLHPAVVVFALLITSTLFGFVGLLLAIPLVAAIHVLVRELWISRMDTMGVDPNPPEDLPQKRPKALSGAPSKGLSRIWRAARGLLRS